MSKGSDERLSRRQFLQRAAVGGGVILGVLPLLGKRGATSQRSIEGLPLRQHAWEAYLRRDAADNAVAPRFNRLLMFHVAGLPTVQKANRMENALRTLEQTYGWGAEGILFVVAWGPRYFERQLGLVSPIERPKALSSFETPEFDDYDVCLHLASDDEDRLAGVERALVDGTPLPEASTSIHLQGVLEWQETRSGFVGEGLPASHQKGVSGIPKRCPVTGGTPLFMGFKSGFKKNQATEDDVTIREGAFAGGTTMHVSRLRERLGSWYDVLDEEQRVARMFSPQLTPAQIAKLADEAPTYTDRLSATARGRGVVGHLQASAGARRNGRPVIIRRDFNTVDDGEAGLHFVALQREIDDFVTTRRAMNAAEMPLVNPGVGPRTNNGIKEFIFVLRRGNYVVPPRPERSFPLLQAKEGKAS